MLREPDLLLDLLVLVGFAEDPEPAPEAGEGGR
jgi:hypothetical protein